MGALASTRARSSARPVRAAQSAERLRDRRRDRVRRPVTLTEVILWGAAAAVMGGFLSLLFVQNWLLALAAILVIGFVVYYWLRR